MSIKQDVTEIIERDLPWETFKGKTFLVTGASGMIPSYVVRTLLELNDRFSYGIRVIGLVRNPDKARGILGESVLGRDDFELLVQDVCDPVTTDSPIDYIVHGGSAARPSEHAAAPVGTIKANLLGTFNLLDLAVEKGSSAFVLMSSSEVYGQVDKTKGTISEDEYGYLDILNPRSCYSEGKRAAETICVTYKVQHGIDCKAVRFGHIYGPGLALTDGRVQAEFAARVIAGEDIVMTSDGSSVRAYTYVGDAVAGLFYALLVGKDVAYNVADGGGIVSIKQLAQAFAAARPKSHITVTCAPAQEQDGLYNPAQFIALDDKRIRSLGWEPKVTLAQGVDRMLSSYEGDIDG